MVTVIARVKLNWSADEHWADEMRPCRCCGTNTHARDEQGRPCHVSCAEAELAAEVLGAIDGRLVDERTTGGVR